MWLSTANRIHTQPLSDQQYIHNQIVFYAQVSIIKRKFHLCLTVEILLNSGFLLAITTFYRKRSSSFGRYLLTRWLRFTPSVLGYVAFTILLGAIGSGPLFHSKLIDPYIRPCVENIWSQLFYFNNWNNFNDMASLLLINFCLLIN